MDNPFRQQEIKSQHSNGLLSACRFSMASCNGWQVSLRLTEDEQEDAGIYLDHQGDE